MSRKSRPTAAWLFLVVATMFSLWANAHAGGQFTAVAIIMTIAAAKVVVVLQRFMRADRLALPLRCYLYAWSAGCAGMIVIVVGISAKAFS